MSSSIQIPARPGASPHRTMPDALQTYGSLDSIQSSLGSSSMSSSPTTEDPRRTPQEKGKQKRRVSDGFSPRRTSWLSASMYQTEHTVVDVGEPDGVPRLITCVKASQGFDWNQDIFLPAYVLPGRWKRDPAGELERRPDPVQEIWVTEEEVKCMFPS